MKGASQRGLPLRQTECRIQVAREKRAELVRWLAELLLQAFKSEATSNGGEAWRR